MGISAIRANDSEIQNLSGWANANLLCRGSPQPYAVVCYRKLIVIQRRIENETAGTGLIVLAIVLAVIMVSTIISLGLYVRHLRKKLKNLSHSDDESSGIELDQPLNKLNDNDISMDSKNVGGESEKRAKNL
jgi:hypothetical protein